MLALGDIKRQADFVLLGKDESRANTCGRQKVVSEVAKILRDFTKPDKSREDPFLVELPPVFGLYGVHHRVPVPAGWIASEVLAASKLAQEEKRGIIARAANKQPRSQNVFITEGQIIVDCEFVDIGVEVAANTLPIP